jgi:hypothetical protein
MPNAEAVLNEGVRHELKTLPEGFVVLRELSYGEVVERRALVKLTLQGGKGKNWQGELAMANTLVTQYEFKRAIVDHNLDNKDGVRLNFASPVDFGKLNPRVGQEIENLISKMNAFDDEDPEDPTEG